MHAGRDPSRLHRGRPALLGAVGSRRFLGLLVVLAAFTLSACSAGVILRLLLTGNDGHRRRHGGITPPFGPGGSVVAASDLREDGKVEVFGLDLEGNEQVDLSSPIVAGGTTRRIGVSPDRTHVAFIASKDTPGVDELYVADLGHSAPAIKIHPALPSGRRVRDFRWSPDSSRIAYVADQDTCGTFQLFTSRVTGDGNAKVLDDAAGPVVFPLSEEFEGTVAAFLWSPDSLYLAVGTDDPCTDASDLFVATPDGSSSHRLASADGGGNGLPMWRKFQRPYIPFEWSTSAALPDRIAFLVETSSQKHVKGSELRIAFVDGSDDRRLSHCFDKWNPDPDDLRLAWAPDGSRIVYVTDGQEADRFELWSTDPRTTDPDHDSFRLSKNSGDKSFDVAYVERDSFEWSPDSSRVAFRGDLDCAGVLELFTVDPTVEEPPNCKINKSLQYEQFVAAFRWSPDSARLAYIADETKRGAFALFSATGFGDDRHVVSRGSSDDDVDVLFTTDDKNPAYTAFDHPIQWSPDSRRLAYLADQEKDGVFEAFTAMADGSNNFRICSDLAQVCGDVCRVTWFDSSLLLYAADEREFRRFELMSAFTDGPTGTILTGSDRRGGTACPDYEIR